MWQKVEDTHGKKQADGLWRQHWLTVPFASISFHSTHRQGGSEEILC